MQSYFKTKTDIYQPSTCGHVILTYSASCAFRGSMAYLRKVILVSARLSRSSSNGMEQHKSSYLKQFHPSREKVLLPLSGI